MMSVYKVSYFGILRDTKVYQHFKMNDMASNPTENVHYNKVQSVINRFVISC